MELENKLREIGSLMPYGSKKQLAKKHGVDYQRAKDIFRGRVKRITEADEAFVDACLDLATPFKNRINKILTF